MNDNKHILMNALQFHGHKCWDSGRRWRCWL